MKLSAIALLLLAVSCQPSTPWLGKAILDEQFELPFDGTVVLTPDSVEITFTDVLEDSRCALDVVCIWAGAVKIEVEILTKEGTQAIVNLSTVGTGEYDYNSVMWGLYPHTVDTLGYRITLLGVDPYPAYADRPIPAEDYLAHIEVAPAWDETAINLVDDDTRDFFANHPMTAVDYRLTGLEGDSLVVEVGYAGGCGKHWLYLLGSCSWQESEPPQMQALLLHDGRGDTCEAYIQRTLRFDLSPLRSCSAASDSLIISLPGDTASVTFAL